MAAVLFLPKSQTISTMKTKTAMAFPVSGMKQKVTPSNLQDVSRDINRFLDIMHEPQYREEYFKKLLVQKSDEMTLLAINDVMEVSFSIRIKTPYP
jgi:hypothetical protein